MTVKSILSMSIMAMLVLIATTALPSTNAELTLAAAATVVNLAQRVFSSARSDNVVAFQQAQAGLANVDLSITRELVELKPTKLERYIEMLIKQYVPSMSPSESAEIGSILNRILIFEPSQFSAEHIHLSYADSNGYCILFRIDVLQLPYQPNVYVAFSLTTTAFKMAPNVAIIRHSRGKFFGSRQWDEIVYSPHYLTPGDVQAITTGLVAAITSPPESFVALLPQHTNLVA